MKHVKKVRFAVDEVEGEDSEKQKDISCIMESDACEGDISAQPENSLDLESLNICDPTDENIASEINSDNAAFVSECNNVQLQTAPVTENLVDSENTKLQNIVPGSTKDIQEISESSSKKDARECVHDVQSASSFKNLNEEMTLESASSNDSVHRGHIPADDSDSSLVLSKDEEAGTNHISEGSLTEDVKLLNDDHDLSKSVCERLKQCLPIRKQSLELNSLLKQYSFDVDSAKELKSAVFNAWCQLKKSEVNAKKNSERSSVKEDKAPSEKASSLKPHIARVTHSKPKFKKVQSKNTNTVAATLERGKSQSDKEENEMAFKSWVKKKNELIKQKKIQKYEKEQEEKLDSIMSEQLKKQEAETAYLAWKIQKYEANKKEKQMKDWILQHEENRKTERSEEALEMYYLWLQNKHSRKSISYKTVEDKPPWIPSGRS